MVVEEEVTDVVEEVSVEEEGEVLEDGDGVEVVEDVEEEAGAEVGEKQNLLEVRRTRVRRRKRR